MCIRLKNSDKDDVHQAIPKFCVEYTYPFYFKTLYSYCVYPSEKLH